MSLFVWFHILSVAFLCQKGISSHTDPQFRFSKQGRLCQQESVATMHVIKSSCNYRGLILESWLLLWFNHVLEEILAWWRFFHEIDVGHFHYANLVDVKDFWKPCCQNFLPKLDGLFSKRLICIPFVDDCLSSLCICFRVEVHLADLMVRHQQGLCSKELRKQVFKLHEWEIHRVLWFQ